LKAGGSAHVDCRAQREIPDLTGCLAGLSEIRAGRSRPSGGCRVNRQQLSAELLSPLERRLTGNGKQDHAPPTPRCAASMPDIFGEFYISTGLICSRCYKHGTVGVIFQTTYVLIIILCSISLKAFRTLGNLKLLAISSILS